MQRQWESVIGLEIHIQLATKSKIFCGSATAYGAAPNTQANALDLGMPGTLPVFNREALHMAIRFGLAVGAKIAPRSVFSRKNYFYPDLPKGYQITQFELPIVGPGALHIDLADGTSKRVGITRAHLEEDAGKSVHEGLRGHTGIDLNRAGTPLLELVTEPELSSAAEAVAFMRKVHTLVRYLGICDGNMQEGSFRCDANVSVRAPGQSEMGTRVELKNINSFRFVERAIDYEIHRQVHLLESGTQVIQETRLYDSDRHETRSMRSKEEAEDYRYFPDPDLLPVILEEGLLPEIEASIPELPDAKKQRYVKALGLGLDEAVALTHSPELAAWFELTLAAAGGSARVCANWVLGELAGSLHKAGLSLTDSPVSPSDLAGLLKRLHDGTISGKIAKMVFDAMFNREGSADAIIENRGLKQITDISMIESVVDQVLAGHPEQIEQYQGGDQKVFNFFVGQVMKETRGKANPGQLREILQKKLS